MIKVVIMRYPQHGGGSKPPSSEVVPFARILGVRYTYACMAILVDTHKIYSKLIEAGFEKAKADAIVDTFSMAEEGLATKADISMLKNEFDLVRRDVEIWKRDIKLQVWSVGATIIGVMAAFNFLG
jgi:hypothetical protein